MLPCKSALAPPLLPLYYEYTIQYYSHSAGYLCSQRATVAYCSSISGVGKERVREAGADLTDSNWGAPGC